MPPHKSYTLCDGIYLSESEAKKLTDESLKWEERKPIGIRFNPSERALARICVDKCFHHADNVVLSFIKDKIEVYDHEPWSLSNLTHEFGEGKSYFFSHRRKKYRTGKNADRTVAGCGFWRKTGSDSSIEIIDNSVGKLRVRKTQLTFYKKDENSGEHEKTLWLMKEYMLEINGNENFAKSDDLDQLVLCVIYSNDNGKQNQSHKSGTRSESFDKVNDLQSSMPNWVLGSSQVSNNIITSSPPIPIPKYPDSYCLRSSSVPCADLVNPGYFPFSTSTPPEIFGNFSNSQFYPGSNPGVITRQQELAMFPSSEPNMVIDSQGATYWSSLNTEPVARYCFQLMQDSGQSSDSCMGNIPNQQAHLMDDQPPPDPCENSYSFVCSPSDEIEYNSLLGQNRSLNYNIDQSTDPYGPLFSPFPYENFLCSNF